ncbi:MAG: YihY/virulence factor BrkB family protein [Bacteroidales bacterium]|nr:YihY/virulence factor BrkB family protein [Bacteroidales bacterium]
MRKYRMTDRKVTWTDIKELFTDKVWGMETDFATGAWRRLVSFIRIVRKTFDSFAEHRMGFQCVALSYFVTLAIIPLTAFIFFVSNGLKIADKLEMLLTRILPNNLDLVSIAINKADNIIAAAQSGPVGLFSALLFMWTIIWLMFQTERVFNNVWGIRKIPRATWKRFGFYIGLLLLIPFLVIIFCYGIAIYSNAVSLIGLNAEVFTRFLGWLLFYAVVVGTLSAAFKYIPACFVRYKHAFIAALFSGAIFCAFQYLYLETQMFVSRLNAVYGVIAAIPLFLIWLNYSFQIVMYGAQLTYALQDEEQRTNQ